tara:strand:- start:489 stop:698 length:210 start_codon:yes stop_codon:yes gene_type:complete
MAVKKSSAEECCSKCEKDIAALKKEIAALKKELKAKSSGGADPRVDVLIEALTRNPGWSWAKIINEKLK